MIRIFRAAALILFVSNQVAANAGPGCDPAVNSILDCWHKHVPEVGAASVVARTEQSATLADLVTAVDLAGGSAGSALTNFLPLLALSGFGGDLNSGSAVDKTGEDLGIDVNLPFFGSKGANAVKVQVVTVRRPTVYAPLLESIDEAERDAFKNSAESDLGIGDDVRVSVAYNLVDGRFGRDFKRHRYLFDALYASATNAVARPAFPLIDVFKAIQPMLSDADAGTGSELIALPFAKYQSIPTPEVQQNIMEIVEQAALGVSAYFDDMDGALTNWRVLEFHKLVDNQPKLFFGATAKRSKQVVGPDELSALIKFEFPVGGNVNGLIKKMKNRDGTPCVTGQIAQFKNPDLCLNAYSTYITNLTQIQASAPRFAFSLEYVDIDDYEISISDPSPMTFQRDGTRKLIAAASLGMRFQNSEGILENSRFDFSLRYEDVDDDPDRNDRSIASATWTKKIGTISIPLTLVYSNRPEFLDEQGLDERFAATIGLRYELNRNE
ncbi:MAG: hypothetical protein O7B25_10425 [Gammaproteobacteria bacterium]|nr:hypothetical protein [Gammaproteobacteria bacterium]